MNKALKCFNFTILSLLITFSVACSSDGGGSGEAELSSTNVEDLAIAGTEGVKQAINNSNVPLPFLAKTNTSSPVKNLTFSLAQNISQNPKFVIEDITDEVCPDGGSAIADIDDDNATATLSACINGSTIANGILTISTSSSGNTTILIFEFNNLTITTPSGMETINGEATCRLTGTDFFCEFDSKAPGIDGRVYEVSSISVAFDPANGYSVGCLVDDPDHGDIIVSTNIPVRLCSNGQPSSGEIVITDGGGKTATITFAGCDSYSVTFDGSTTTFFWP